MTVSDTHTTSNRKRRERTRGKETHTQTLDNTIRIVLGWVGYVPSFQIDFAAWLVPMAANISASSPCDGIATAGAHAVNGYFMDVAHCHEAAEHFFRPDAGQLREIATADASLLHQFDARLTHPSN